MTRADSHGQQQPVFRNPSGGCGEGLKKIKDNPSKIIVALYISGCHTDKDLAFVRSRAILRAVRHAGPAVRAHPKVEERRRVRRCKATTGPYHVYTQSSKRVPTTAPHYLELR